MLNTSDLRGLLAFHPKPAIALHGVVAAGGAQSAWSAGEVQH